MIARHRFSLFAVFACSALASVACGGASNATTPEAENTDQTEAALDQKDGALTDAAESPDPAFSAVPEFTADLADTEDMTVEAAKLPGATSYHIALLWGHLPAANDDSDTDADPMPVDWTGAVSVDGGGIRLVRTLRFDARDSIERPRTDRTKLAFTSHTLPAVDGLFLRVVIPAGGSTLLHFNTSALDTDVDLAQLEANAGGVTPLGDGRNGLAWIGYADRRDCDRGLLFGRWIKDRARLGELKGRILDGDGATIGAVRGIWGHAKRADKNVFFGKAVGRDGAFEGLFGGEYRGGHAVGRWAAREDDGSTDVGGLQLFYSDGYERGDGRGVFVGRWQERCTGAPAPSASGAPTDGSGAADGTGAPPAR